MSIWAAKRRLIYLSYIGLFFTLVAIGVYFAFVYKPPTCFDNVQNGFEEGVDCGGGCQLVCPFSATMPNIKWSRAFEIAPGLYNLSALIENPNFSVGADVDYVLRAYNEENILVSEIYDSVPLYPAETRPIFVPSVETGKRSISRVFLEFVDEPQWYRLEQKSDRLVSQGYVLEDVLESPKMRATIYNTDRRAMRDIVVMAVLFDEDENIYQTSQTFVERIEADSRGQAFFTWRKPFEKTIQNVEIYIIEPLETTR